MRAIQKVITLEFANAKRSRVSRGNRAESHIHTNIAILSRLEFVFLLVAPPRLLSHEWDSFRFFSSFASASYRAARYRQQRQEPRRFSPRSAATAAVRLGETA